MRIVDAHVHVVSADRDRYPRGDLGSGGGGGHTPEEVSGPRLLQLLDEAETEYAVFVQSLGAYGFDNRYAADASDRSDGRCPFVCAIEPDDPDAVAEVHRWVKSRGASRGARSVRLIAFQPPADLGRFQRVWAEAQACGASICLLTPLSLVKLFAPLVERSSESPVVLEHCGLAQLDASRADLGAPELLELADLGGLHLKISSRVLGSVVGNPSRALTRLTEAFGASRIAWGSDFPATRMSRYESALEMARQAVGDLSASDQHEILAEPARRLSPPRPE
jgi:predicted TIM-barrel fold metal-dependent hydrolase